MLIIQISFHPHKRCHLRSDAVRTFLSFCPRLFKDSSSFTRPRCLLMKGQVTRWGNGRTRFGLLYQLLKRNALKMVLYRSFMNVWPMRGDLFGLNNSQDGSRNAPWSSVEKRALVEFEICSEIKYSWKRKVHVKISAFLIEMEVSPSMNKLNILD